jgi:hypothetical protein
MIAMVAALFAIALAPWSQPLAFHPMAGWHTGASGNTHSQYIGHKKWVTTPLESAAWIATGVRYLDPATADPPNATLATLPEDAVIVWAVIYSPIAENEKPIRLNFRSAKRYACCEAAPIPDEYELTGSEPGTHHEYSVIVRIYFGSKPTAPLKARAELALRHLVLPPAR